MTKDELLAELDGYPGDTQIVMSKDQEGNGFSPLSSVYEGFYEATCTWAGELVNEDEGGKFALFLWPVN